jgi:hypothetical protein
VKTRVSRIGEGAGARDAVAKDPRTTTGQGRGIRRSDGQIALPGFESGRRDPFSAFRFSISHA